MLDVTQCSIEVGKLPKIVWRENNTVKTKYVTKEEREIIEKIKITNNYKTLKEAYFHYIENKDFKDEPIDTSNNNILEIQNKYEEKIKILENTISELQKKYDEQVKENKFIIERLTTYCKEKNVNMSYFLYRK